MTLQPGQMLSSYRLVRRIGAGGMGEVWKAVDTKLDREVALKVLSSQATDTDERLKRFEREAKAVAALNHPNIVTLFSVEEADGVPFITVELIEGKTLADVIPDDGVTLGEFFDLAVPLTDALHAAHERGVVHRDLKPANIMITTEGRLKILDFGLAKLREVVEEGEATPHSEARTHTLMTQAGQVMGTMPYMSPEQVQGKPLDHRTDIFSVGVIFHEMATGKRPFTGGSSADLISSILRDTPAPVSESKVDFPNHLSRIVRHCLEKDPERRYQTAKDVRDDLQELKQEVASGELPRKIVPPRRRIHPVLALASLAVVVALAGLGWWMFQRTQTPSPSVTAATGGAVEKSIAVLPFVDMSEKHDQEYFADGLSEELMGASTSRRSVGSFVWSTSQTTRSSTSA